MLSSNINILLNSGQAISVVWFTSSHRRAKAAPASDGYYNTERLYK